MSRSLKFAAAGAAVLLGTGGLAYVVADGMVSRPPETLRAQIASRNETARAWAAGRQAELDAARAAAEAEVEQVAEAQATEAGVEAGAAVSAEASTEEVAASDAASETSAADASEEAPAPEPTETDAAATAEADAKSAEETAEAVAATAVPLDATPSTGPFALGRLATEDEIAAWNIDVRPDGVGLPEGSGSVAEGEGIYQERCAACHGTFGEAIGRWPVLAGGEGTLKADRPNKTIGSYWPYTSTIFDYVHRAMPFGAGQSLTDDETYAITAYLLNLNFLVDDDFVLSRETFAEVAQLPNADAFFPDDRAETEMAAFVSTSACMEDCKDAVTITKRAAVLDVTPEAGGGDLDGGGASTEVAEADTASEAEPSAPETVAEDNAPTTETAAAGPDPALVAAGEALFRQCQSCHQVGEGAKNRVGPQLNGVVGREIGAIEDFKYSKAFEEAHAAGDVWTEDALAAFLKDPRGAMKGTKMSFRGLKDDADAAAIIAYLAATGG